MRVQRPLAILFADIAGSTRLFETLGDARAREVTSRCIRQLMQVTREFQGRVVKTIGDEVMCVFASAAKAAGAAVKMQEDVEDQGDAFGVELHIRVGFHFGEVIVEDGDVFGDAVNVAARMASQAKAQQILTTKETVARLDPALQAETRLIDRAPVKGKQELLEIFEITWGKEEDLTIIGGGLTQKIAQAKGAGGGMSVRYKGVEVTVDEKTPSISFGRGPQNRFVVDDSMASRLHASIEFRRGKYVLVDKSTNGTYVHTNAGKKSFVHRDEIPLEGTGVVGIGKEVSPSSPEAVHFSVN